MGIFDLLIPENEEVRRKRKELREAKRKAYEKWKKELVPFSTEMFPTFPMFPLEEF